jgi:rod shape-determining protein MreC
VIAAGGLAGKITSVTGGQAQVTLITDESSAVSAEVMPDGSSGIVRPEVGNPNDMLLDYIAKGAKIQKGDSVVTSGFTSSRLDSLFPRDIPVGKVTKVEPSELELYQRVHLQPYADLRRMDYVQVLTGSIEQQRAQVIK